MVYLYMISLYSKCGYAQIIVLATFMLLGCSVQKGKPYVQTDTLKLYIIVVIEGAFSRLFHLLLPCVITHALTCAKR